MRRTQGRSPATAGPRDGRDPADHGTPFYSVAGARRLFVARLTTHEVGLLGGAGSKGRWEGWLGGYSDRIGGR